MTDEQLKAMLRGDPLTPDELKRYAAHAAAITEAEHWRRAYDRATVRLLEFADALVDRHWPKQAA